MWKIYKIAYGGDDEHPLYKVFNDMYKAYLGLLEELEWLHEKIKRNYPDKTIDDTPLPQVVGELIIGATEIKEKIEINIRQYNENGMFFHSKELLKNLVDVGPNRYFLIVKIKTQIYNMIGE